MSLDTGQLRGDLARALTDYRRARNNGQDLVADGAAKRIQTLGTAMTALLLDELLDRIDDETTFDEHAAQAQRHTMQEAP